MTTRATAKTPSAASSSVAAEDAATHSPTRSLLVGLDIGGTKVLGTLLSPDLTPLDSVTQPTRRGEGGVVEVALAVVRELLARANLAPTDLATIGVGIPGTVDREAGTVSNAVNLGVEELALADALSGALGVPVVVENDVNVAGIGAAHLLKRQGPIAFLNVGTGLAACLVDGGQVFSGCSGVAGEIGHLPVDPAGLPCPCGQVGCLETIASGAAVTRRWPSRSAHPSDDLLEAYRRGDPMGVTVFQQLADGIAQAVRALVLAYDPSCVVVGGGIMRLGEPLLLEIHSVFDRWAETSPFIASLDLSGRLCELPVGADVGAIGAALLAKNAD